MSREPSKAQLPQDFAVRIAGLRDAARLCGHPQLEIALELAEHLARIALSRQRRRNDRPSAAGLLKG